MSVAVHPPLQRIVERAGQDPDILAVILFGSRARGDASPASDYDVALVLQPGLMSRLVAFGKRLEYLAIADLDIVVFQLGWRPWWRDGHRSDITRRAASVPPDLVAGDRGLATYALAAELSRER